ncbi:MAG: hypothetical protein F2903_07725 [Actinobacteria bacterium]|uniref:Unannotated protein n=1 Tax=freshwater metagenome TaxID=449393 RepID=A0A6J7RM90_9ZZZZ|nr:hypothetical protein [Actinomycetota bacterium]MSX09310.1 hypothetical protein [Actinomycetota bacterium]MSX68834.1 hypothetical protein [Actinomycetota bacterium]
MTMRKRLIVAASALAGFVLSAGATFPVLSSALEASPAARSTSTPVAQALAPTTTLPVQGQDARRDSAPFEPSATSPAAPPDTSRGHQGLSAPNPPRRFDPPRRETPPPLTPRALPGDRGSGVRPSGPAGL